MKTKYFFSNTIEVTSYDAKRNELVEELLKGRLTQIADKQAVVCQYTPLVMKITNRMWHNGFGHFWGQIEDLFQEGVIGLIKAADGWNPDVGVKFISYAYTCIYRHVQTVTNAGNGIIAVPHHLCGLDDLDEKFNRAIALAYKQARSGVKSLSSDLQVPEDRWDETEFKESLEEVQFALSTLREREIDIIKRRIGLEGEEETLCSIGESYNVSKERIRQVEAMSLAKLKNWLMERDPEECETQVARSKMFTTNLIPHPINSVAEKVAPEEIPA